MMCLTGLGLASMFIRYPMLRQVLQWIGIVYLLWLAWKMVRTTTPVESSAPDTKVCSTPSVDAAFYKRGSRPLGFWGAAAFQWVNPKLWAMTLSLFTTYMPADSTFVSVILVAALFGLVNLPCVSVWAVAGQQLRHWLQNPQTLRWFNWSMAALLLASMLPALIGKH